MTKFLWILIVFAAFSVCASAQNDSLMKAYSGWKDTRSVKLTDSDVHYGLAVSTIRDSADRGVLELMPVGDIGKLTVKITPVTIERDESGKITSQVEGETVSANQAAGRSKTHISSPLNVIVPILSNSNAVKIVWNFVANGEKISSTILLPLDSDRSVNFVGIVPKETSTPLCPLCYEVSGSSERCGFFYKCCLTLIGNVIDFTSCSVSCGEDC